MRVHVFTDISYCQRTDVGAYGLWAGSERGTCQHAASFKDKVHTTVAAEYAAIALGLRLALDKGLGETGDHFMFYTDCLDVAEFVNTSIHKRWLDAPLAWGALEDFRFLIVGSTFEAIHTRGHTLAQTPEACLNRLVDALANRAMNKRRNELYPTYKTEAARIRRINQQKVAVAVESMLSRREAVRDAFLASDPLVEHPQE